MARLSTLGLSLVSLTAPVAHAWSNTLTHGDIEADELASGRGLCGRGGSDPLTWTPPTCGPSLVGGFGSKPSEWFPWTHRPYCADTQYCVFTNAHFQNGIGVSIITTPEDAAGTLDKLEESFTIPLQRPRGGAPLYKVVDMPGRGKGATKLFQGKKLLETAVDQLPRGHAIRSLAMSTNTTERVVEDLLRTNSFGMSLENRSTMVLFPEISRMNHACNPNAFIRFSEKTLANTAIANRDIEAGQELTISSVEFSCDCALCSLSEEEVEASDDRRERIRDVRSVVLDHVKKNEYSQAIKKHKTMIQLIAEEGITVPLGEYYDILARLYNTIGDRRNTEIWAKRAIDDLELFGGEEIYDQIPELRDILDGIV
ncbi:unnamed protein product [Parascedosporium putredinis]|uniref:SET domain-containing protein n=1 Tax=Parascedosporium putredinis TaxID=1442378 RepID=A0A9P1GXW3_9PEZI|nr:unnamed protein product [Parascedosporium putredinis]CAI7989375.1 unnamed protein product [Parascedosporium putredinis]